MRVSRPYRRKTEKTRSLTVSSYSDTGVTLIAAKMLPGVDSKDDLVQLGAVFDLQRHLVLVFLGDAGQFTVDGRFVTPKSVTATSASGRYHQSR
jgi:hypothetical protein